MKEVRNPDDRLVCRIDETTGNIEILEKGWVTVVHRNNDGSIKVTHQRKEAVSAK